MQLFFSYARLDRLRVDSLVTRLRQAGIEIWLDSDLVGGWPWWDKILGQLGSCDAVLAAVSRASTNSQASRAEREYAAQLGKPQARSAGSRTSQGPLPTFPLPSTPPPSAAPPGASFQKSVWSTAQWWSNRATSTAPQQPQPISTKPPWPRPQQPQPAGTPPPQPQPPRSGAVPSAGVVKAHRGMVIVSAIITVPTVILAPIGIMALIYSSQAKTNLALGNAMGASEAFARVVAAFWVAISIWIIFTIYLIAKGASTGSGTSSASIISHSVLS
jgi:TIR domain